jgi:putative Holliday junction resolvase
VSHNPTEEFIGVDLGASRVGLARGSSAARLAEPLKTVPASEAIEAIVALAKETNAQGVIVGFPRNMSGQETSQTQSVKQWVNQAKTHINLPFYWQDESLTSKVAEAKDHPAGADAVAASVILQDFLDIPKDERVRS